MGLLVGHLKCGIVLGYGPKNRKDQYPCNVRLASRKQQNLESSPGDQQSKNL